MMIYYVTCLRCRLANPGFGDCWARPGARSCPRWSVGPYPLLLVKRDTVNPILLARVGETSYAQSSKWRLHTLLCLVRDHSFPVRSSRLLILVLHSRCVGGSLGKLKKRLTDPGQLLLLQPITEQFTIADLRLV